MTDRLLKHGAGEWLLGEGAAAGIVVSTRIRLARNVSGYPFKPRLSLPEAEELLALLRKKTLALGNTNHIFFDMRELDAVDSMVMVERHLVSRELSTCSNPCGVTVREGEGCSIMLLEEDHIRIQVMASGLQVKKSWNSIEKTHRRLAADLPLSFQEDLGYLTSCPTNVGTGLRVSCMLHLPALIITRQIEKTHATAQKIHMVVRGLYGEGSQPASDLFQISNQVTLGRTEEDICSELTAVVEKIVSWEEETRAQLLEKKGSEVKERLEKAEETLKNAQVITSEEALQLLSSIRMGIQMGLITNISLQDLNLIFLLVQPGHLQKLTGEKLGPMERDEVRAEKLKELMG